ncbi:hypothetical protein ACPBEH_02620 [Latilactobacillus sp. 5-91]|uniref:hypothetical protein n=1 Tax=Latilactobacillus sp. 5-91 TaxID=3410924 RepID=UPI003C779825
MIQIDGFIFLLLLISVAVLCYGAGKIGFKNLWGFDDDKSNSNVIKFIDGRYVKPNRKAQ